MRNVILGFLVELMQTPRKVKKVPAADANELKSFLEKPECVLFPLYICVFFFLSFNFRHFSQEENKEKR